MENVQQGTVEGQGEKRPGRSVLQRLGELMEEANSFHVNPAHRKPRCVGCGCLLSCGRIRHTPTGNYMDNETMCAFCVGERNERLARELRREAL